MPAPTVILMAFAAKARTPMTRSRPDSCGAFLLGSNSPHNQRLTIGFPNLNSRQPITTLYGALLRPTVASRRRVVVSVPEIQL